MATNHPDVEDLITCDLCFEWYASPRRLPCPHVYCLKCLRAMLEKNDNKKQIRCPECQIKHTVPDNGAEGFPLDVKLHHFITTNKKTKENVMVIENDSKKAEHYEDFKRFLTFASADIRNGNREREFVSILCFWYILELAFKMWENGSTAFSLPQLIILSIVLYYVFRSENDHPLNEKPLIIRICLYIICVILNIFRFWNTYEISYVILPELPTVWSTILTIIRSTFTASVLTMHLVFCTLYLFTAWCCYSTLRKIRNIRRWQEVPSNHHLGPAAAREGRGDPPPPTPPPQEAPRIRERQQRRRKKNGRR